MKSTYILFKWKPSMYSEPYANKNKLVTFLIPERGQTRLLNFSAAQVKIQIKKACVEEALTFYFDGKNP